MPPPALSNPPQFSAEYWDKVPRQMAKVKLAQWRKIDEPDGKQFIEFIFDNGAALQRNVGDIDQDVWEKVHVNCEMFVQTVKDELVTGLHLPNVGWVFKMSSEDLAGYARRLTEMLHRRRQQAREELVEFVTSVLTVGIMDQCEVENVAEDSISVIGPLCVRDLAVRVIESMASAKPAENANT